MAKIKNIDELDELVTLDDDAWFAVSQDGETYKVQSDKLGAVAAQGYASDAEDAANAAEDAADRAEAAASALNVSVVSHKLVIGTSA